MASMSLLVLAVLFIAVVILSNAFLKGTRLDLTENHLYTLSDGTKNILGNIDEPVNLYYFFSEQTSRSIPTLRTYATRVREMLDEFVLHSDGKLNLQVIDPVPFSEEEDRANQFGLQAIPVGASGESVYFGLVGTNSVDGVESIRFFQPDKESFLEYDMTKMIYNLAHPKKPVIGVLAQLPFNGGFDPMSRQPLPPWVIGEQLSQLFEMRTLSFAADKIDDDVDVLMIVHPKAFNDQTLYAIDQFILKGGHALIFVDPQADADIPPDAANNPQAMFAERSSNMKKLFDAWGIEVDTTKILGDAAYALTVNFNPNQPPARHVGIMSIDKNGLQQDDVITAELSTINLSFPGYIQRKDDAKVEMTPLITSSNQAMPIDSEKARFAPDPNQLSKDFSPTGERYVIAARLSGKVPTAFPDGPPPKAEDAQDQKTEEDKDKSEPAEQLKESQQPMNVVLVADTDMLTDRMWVRTNNFFGQRIASAWANNGDFVSNALDNLLGNSDLIGMRSRATSTRPFTTVQALEREADTRYRATEQELMARLQETEQKLSELQNARQDSENQSALILSPEQRAEVEKFQENKLEIRKQLRQVRRDLDQNIEQLGTWMKFINIGLVPILLSILAVIVALIVRSRRRAHSSAA
jgi:ABC-type uncharacterized transport system involved in gliding motility auxiliary subunit